MNPHNKTASLAGLTVPVMSKAVAASSYQNSIAQATAESYATATLLTRFSMRIETARLICRPSGLGGCS
jgi:hypothetical protein